MRSWAACGLRSVVSGGASAVKEPGHFKVRKSSSQVTQMHFFPQKSWRPFFSCRRQNTGRQRRFTVKIKQIKRSDMVTFLFSVYIITEAKQYAGLSQGGGSSSQVTCVVPPLSVVCWPLLKAYWTTGWVTLKPIVCTIQLCVYVCGVPLPLCGCYCLLLLLLLRCVSAD